MVELPEELPNKTVEAIYKYYEDTASDWRRNHLGASLIGKECERSLWYSFRWATKPKFNGRMLRLFETGNREEKRIINNLRNLGITVWDHDPETGLQINFGYSGGHYAGSLDGIGIGFLEAEKTWHVVECKTAGIKSFKELKKSGVRLAKFEHYSQMQQYMAWSELDRAYYFCVCKDTDEIYAERVYFDKEYADRLKSKAERIIFSPVPLHMSSDADKSPTCLFCEHKDVCRQRALPEINCRTCALSTPLENGTWVCEHHACAGHVIEPIDQRRVHPCHVFIPDFVPLDQTDASQENATISYGSIVNGEKEIQSVDLQPHVNAILERKRKMHENSGISKTPRAPSEPDMSGVAYQTEYDPV